ncbi:hypothetical protein Golomagni_08125, partial [Golovinomyces magnicellulatus]
MKRGYKYVEVYRQREQSRKVQRNLIVSKSSQTYTRRARIEIIFYLFIFPSITMTNNPVALILGSGPRVGNSVARRLANNGYAVAVASRKGTGSRNDQGVLDIKADFSHVESIQHVFSTVKAEFGQPPSIVIYNAAALTPPPVQNLILSIQPEQLASDLTVNTISPFAAAQKAVDEWESLKSDAAKVFIYTGNISNVQLVPM